MSVLTKIDVSVAAPKDRHLQERLSDGLAPKMLPVFEDVHAEILAVVSQESHLGNARAHAEALAKYCAEQGKVIERLTAAEQQFQTRLANAVDEAEERAAILAFARALGADRKQLQADRKAFDAWFDADAVIERFQKRVGERERALAHAIERLGPIAADYAATDPLMSDTAFFIDLADGLLNEMRNWRGDARVRHAVHTCLAAIASQIDHWPFGYWFEDVLSTTRRVCLDQSEDVWVQCAAFDALMALSPQSIPNAIKARLKTPSSSRSAQAMDNDLFLRRHLVRLVASNLWRDDVFPKILGWFAEDEKGAVRQAIADVIQLLPADLATARILALRIDPDPQVRAAIFADVPRMLASVSPELYVEHIAAVLAQDDNEFVLRIALDAARNLAGICGRTGEELDPVVEQIRSIIDDFKKRRLSPKFLRWADEAHEAVWLGCDREAVEIARIIQAGTKDLFEAGIRRISPLSQWLPEHDEKVGRVMAVLAQNDFGLSVKMGRKPSIQRGEWIKRRFWRILFEGRNSATDKRQAHVHTTGRHYHGTLIAPSARMAELAPTKVPGEPLFESQEGGWRNYLPLIDQVLSALDHGEPIQLFTSAGITEITPPKDIWRRGCAFVQISRNFAELAGVRNREPADFLAAIRAYGIEIEFRAYSGVQIANPEICALFAREQEEGDK